MNHKINECLTVWVSKDQTILKNAVFSTKKFSVTILLTGKQNSYFNVAYANFKSFWKVLFFANLIAPIYSSRVWSKKSGLTAQEIRRILLTYCEKYTFFSPESTIRLVDGRNEQTSTESMTLQ